MTQKRAAILQVLRESEGHLSADEIFGHAKAEMPSIALGTVYRNLRLMVEDREIRQISTGFGPDRYDRNMIPHEHLHCDGCGKLVDITFGGLKELLEVRGEIVVEAYELNIRGLCAACKRNQRKKVVQ